MIYVLYVHLVIQLYIPLTVVGQTEQGHVFHCHQHLVSHCDQCSCVVISYSYR